MRKNITNRNERLLAIDSRDQRGKELWLTSKEEQIKRQTA